MRKDTKIIVMKNYNDFMGGMCNAYMDGNLKECYENLKGAEDVVDVIYLNSTADKSEIKFDGEDNIKDFIIDLMMKDKEGQKAIRGLRKKIEFNYYRVLKKLSTYIIIKNMEVIK